MHTTVPYLIASESHGGGARNHFAMNNREVSLCRQSFRKKAVTANKLVLGKKKEKENVELLVEIRL